MRIIKRVAVVLLIAAAAALVLAAASVAVAAGGGERVMTGVVVSESNVSLDVAAQPGVARSLVVASVIVPGPSWIVVHLDDNGAPGMRIGLEHISGGSLADVTVALDDVALTDELIVAVHADRGVAGTFDFAMDRFESSPDKPYFVDGMEVATRVRVR